MIPFSFTVIFSISFSNCDAIYKLERVKENGITVNFYMLPFVKSAYISHIFQLQTDSYEECFRYLIEHTKIDEEETNILLSHQFVTANKKNPELSDSETSSLGGIDNIDFHIFDPFDYVALSNCFMCLRFLKLICITFG